jgi:hypothetical protein
LTYRAPARSALARSLRRALCSAAALLLLGALAPAQGRTKKAVLIGINCYNPNSPECGKLSSAPVTTRVQRVPTNGNWRYWNYLNLEGAVNDVELMKSILEAHQFEIPSDAVLLDEQASADAILFTLHKYLVDEANEGDLRVVYYSGHGNYVRNRATNELDETMVPSDHWRGTADIRDKELSRILWEAGNRKHVKVVFIADSCHSGSLTRGTVRRLKTSTGGSADSPDAPWVADPPSKDESNAPIDPGKAGLIFLAAARRDQPAEETDGASARIDDPFSGPHGAFTWALKQALDGDQDAPIDTVFQKTAAFLRIDKPGQVADLQGNDRAAVNVFGEPARGGASQRVIVQSVASGGVISLNGGRAVGIYAGTELVGGSPALSKVEIQVTEEDGLAFSKAKVIPEGAHPAIKTGDIFEVDRWVVPAGAMLKLYVPPSAPAAALAQTAAELASLKADSSLQWLDDETAATPTHVMSWSGAAWTVDKFPPDGHPVNLGASPTAAQVKAALAPNAKFLFLAPPPAELTAALPFAGEAAGRIQIASAADAHYLLHGRLREGALEYAWVRPDLGIEAVRAKLSETSMPARTNFVPLGAGDAVSRTASALADLAYRTGRLQEWLELRPPGPPKQEFPYKLAFREVGTDNYIDSGDVAGGKKYKIYLRASDQTLKSMKYSVPGQYVYVFTIDQFGKGTLLWPELGRGNQDNFFPAPVAEGEPAKPAEPLIPVSGQEEWDFEVGEPYGRDTYILLTSEQRVDNPDVFEFDGVRTKGAERGAGGNPLDELLSGVGSLSRAATRRVPTNWDLKYVYLQSGPPK